MGICSFATTCHFCQNNNWKFSFSINIISIVIVLIIYSTRALVSISMNAKSGFSLEVAGKT